MKGKRIYILFIFIGVILVIYPILSNLVGKYTHTVAISKYEEQTSNLTDKQKEDELEKARQYNEDLTNNNEDVTYNSYLNALNIGEVIAYIDIPKINVYLPIYHGISENVLQSGIGHIEKTSLPVGGKGTHCVLTGHTGLVRSKMFDDIKKLELGDKFFIHVLDEILAYEVDDIRVVLPNEVDSLKRDINEDYVTLVTCTPYMINTHRLLVRGKRTELEETSENINLNDIQKEQFKLSVFLIIIIVVLFLIIISFIIYNKNKTKYISKHREQRRRNDN